MAPSKISSSCLTVACGNPAQSGRYRHCRALFMPRQSWRYSTMVGRFSRVFPLALVPPASDMTLPYILPVGSENNRRRTELFSCAPLMPL